MLLYFFKNVDKQSLINPGQALFILMLLNNWYTHLKKMWLKNFNWNVVIKKIVIMYKLIHYIY